MLALVALCALASLAGVRAISSGKVSLCEIPPNVYGCEEWEPLPDGTPDRKHCKDPTRIMAWATAPVTKPEWYWLYAGDAADEDSGATEYVPGQRMVIHLRVREYNRQYRGLIMYAVDSKGKTVGEWDFVGRPTIFHGHCPGAVLHASGELKPYLTSFGFTAPAAGTGRITFKAMVKTGVANVGDFFFPNELQLSEKSGAAAPAGQQWFRAERAGMSCTEVCAEQCGTSCDASRLGDINSPAKLVELVAPFATCSLPSLARCSKLGATSASDETNTCYYHNDADCKALGLESDAPTCGAKPTDSEAEPLGKRLCPCQTPCKTEAPTTVAATTRATATTNVRQTTQAGATTLPAPTAPPAGECPSSNAGLGCPCDVTLGGACQPNMECVANSGNAGACVPISSTGCALGATVGCACKADADCGTQSINGVEQALVCSDMGYCLVEKRFDCDSLLGTVGCWCTEERTCDPGLECSNENNCVRVAALQDCVEGQGGCACVDGTSCEEGLQCAQFGAASLCVVAQSNLTGDDDPADAANSLAMTSSLVALSAVASTQL